MSPSIFIALAVIGVLLASAVWYVSSMRADVKEVGVVRRRADPPAASEGVEDELDDDEYEIDLTSTDSVSVPVSNAGKVHTVEAADMRAAFEQMLNTDADVQDLFVLGTAAVHEEARQRLVDELNKHPGSAAGMVGYTVRPDRSGLAPANDDGGKCEVLSLDEPVAFRRGFFSTDFELPPKDAEVNLGVWVSAYLRDRMIRRRCFSGPPLTASSPIDLGMAADSLAELW